MVALLARIPALTLTAWAAHSYSVVVKVYQGYHDNDNLYSLKEAQSIAKNKQQIIPNLRISVESYSTYLNTLLHGALGALTGAA